MLKSIVSLPGSAFLRIGFLMGCLAIAWTPSQGREADHTGVLPLPNPQQESGTTDRSLDEEDPFPFDFNGFIEARAGTRLWSNRYEKTSTLAEARLHAGMEKSWDRFRIRGAGDVLYDHVTDEHDIDVEEGEGWFDLREAYGAAILADNAGIIVGRQILAWGTAELFFINDLFPKDWRSFYIGRDEAYLRAPSDAVRFHLAEKSCEVDVVYTPRFDADRFVDGRRLSYWNHRLGRRAGRDVPLHADKPDRAFRDDEIAVRLSGDFDGVEAALYGYHGFWKFPAEEEPLTGLGRFPDLSVVGASLESEIAGGTGSLETGYYHSMQDNHGRDPYVRNSEWRFLTGFEKELFPDLFVRFMYYLEWMMDHDAYARNRLPGRRRLDEFRHVAGFRAAKYVMDRKVSLSVTSFGSFSDKDAYAKPALRYRINEHACLECGAHLWVGEENYTIIGQYERNINVYFAVRYSF